MTSNAAQYTWAGRFPNPSATWSNAIPPRFRPRMWRQDIRGSLAHARMLARQGIINSQGSGRHRARGMAQVTEEIDPRFQMVAGPGRCYTQYREAPHCPGRRRRQAPPPGRSRNDQVATDIRLYLRDASTTSSPISPFPLGAARSGRKEAATRCPASPICRSPSR